MCFGGGSSDSKIAQQQRADEVARQSRITQGMSQIDSAFSGFNDDFYKKRATDYEAYAKPTLEKQARATHDSLVYALSRTGNLDSSAGIKKNADLGEEENARRIDIANDGINQGNTLRSNVENARSGVVSQLNATGDSTAAAQSALRETERLNQPQGFSPLGDLFASFASSLSQIGSNASNGYSGLVRGANTLFNNNKGSARVVGA